jgi:hypothetical protein
MAQAKKRVGRVNRNSAQMEENAAVRESRETTQNSNKEGEIASVNHSTSLGLTTRSEDDETLTEIGNTTVNHEEDLESLQHEEMSGSPEQDSQYVNYSDTDEDENEGLGDGNLGRSTKGSMSE